MLLEKWDRSVLDINTMLSFPCGKGKDPVALVSKCFSGRLLLHKCHRSEATQVIAHFGWQIAGGSQVMKFTS